jgi:hypothetical protein
MLLAVRQAHQPPGSAYAAACMSLPSLKVGDPPVDQLSVLRSLCGPRMLPRRRERAAKALVRGTVADAQIPSADRFPNCY